MVSSAWKLVWGLALIVGVSLGNVTQAAIITATLQSGTEATFESLTDVDASTASTALVESRVDQFESFTQSSSDYTLNTADFLLTSRNLVTAEKVQPRQRGGDHFGSSRLYLDFEIDSDMEFSLAGTWGFDNATTQELPDRLSYSLTGSNGDIFSGTTTANGGVGSASFSESGVLSAGTYRLAFDAELSERFTSSGAASAGFEIDGFRLTAVTAIPEASSFGLLALSGLMLATRRRRR